MVHVKIPSKDGSQCFLYFFPSHKTRLGLSVKKKNSHLTRTLASICILPLISHIYFLLLAHLAHDLANSLLGRSRYSSILSATQFQVQQCPILVGIKQLTQPVSKSLVFCSIQLAHTKFLMLHCSTLVHRWLPSLLSQGQIPGRQVSPNF